MQFPAWLVSKVRKPALVISIVVAMASFLIAWGEPTNQGQTTPFDDVMSAIAAQQQESYNAVQQIYNLYQKNAFLGCPAYYVNAKYYYTWNVRYYFNKWLESIASEVQNGDRLLNTGPYDQTWISNALRANYAFTTWESQVNYYFSTNPCSQGQGGYLIATFPKVILPVEPTAFSEFDLSVVFSKYETQQRVYKALKQLSDTIENYLSERIPPTSTLPGGYSTPSVNDLLGVPVWQDFCRVVQGSSC